MCCCFYEDLKYETQDTLELLIFLHFHILVEKCIKVEDITNMRLNHGGNFNLGGPSHQGNHNRFVENNC